VSAAFAIYLRASEEGPGGQLSSNPEDQEAYAREWAERAKIDIDEVAFEVASGALDANDRELGRLIKRCEAGEIGGIIVRDERRFARDVVAGATALNRLVECKARLIATMTGFDSQNLTPEAEMQFNIWMAVGQAERKRNRLKRLNGNRRLADRGGYLAQSAPLGYEMDADRRISPDPAASKLVQEVFQRRAEGQSLRSLATWLREHGIEITKSGVRVVLANRAYLGEMTVPTDRKGELEVRKNAHEPVVTEDLWEQAQAAGGPYHPRNGRWSSQARLTGIARCSGCDTPLSAHGGGKKKDTAYYSCTAEGCKARVGIRVDRLDAWADGLLQQAVVRGVPEVIAVLEGDDRRARALDAVKAARLELETYIAEVRVSDVGRDAWIHGKEVRAAALTVAQRELAAIPAPRPVSRARAKRLMTWDEAEPALDRERNARFVTKIVVYPVGRGRRVPVAERCDVYLVGSDKPADKYWPPADLTKLAA